MEDDVILQLLKKQQKHGKRQRLCAVNGSNLNSREVLSILKMFAVIPFNSPPGFPQFNGVMERSQGEIKRYLHAILKNKEELDSFTVAVHLSVERANRRRRAVLAGKCACERWEEEFSHFTRRERESIYLEIKWLAEGILGTFPRKKRMRKDADAHVWRIAIQRYLESNEYIRLFRDGRDLH